jgi:hypothetical protein
MLDRINISHSLKHTPYFVTTKKAEKTNIILFYFPVLSWLENQTTMGRKLLRLTTNIKENDNVNSGSLLLPPRENVKLPFEQFNQEYYLHIYMFCNI